MMIEVRMLFFSIQMNREGVELVVVLGGWDLKGDEIGDLAGG